jgi:hypothetical protein
MLFPKEEEEEETRVLSLSKRRTEVTIVILTLVSYILNIPATKGQPYNLAPSAWRRC